MRDHRGRRACAGGCGLTGASPARATARVLVIAGSDSGGGAGIQADIKTIAALGGYATTAITALTAQDTTGVHAVHAVPAGFVRAQIACVLADIGADTIKIGMLGDAALIEAVADEIHASAPTLPLVLDPVMVAKGGHRLLEAGAEAMLRRRLLPRATVLTPNIPEAEALTGMCIRDPDGMRAAAAALRAMGAHAVLLKGGHLPGDDLVDVLATDGGGESFASRRIPTRHTHGTGCTLASALAVSLAQGLSLRDAVLRARAYVRAAIAAAPNLGAGHGPLGHAAAVAERPYGSRPSGSSSPGSGSRSGTRASIALRSPG